MDQSTRANKTNTVGADFTTNEPNAATTRGDRVSVFWPENDIYHPGFIDSEAEDGRLNVAYDDGEKECFDMKKETWNLLEASSANAELFSSEKRI